MSNSYKNIVVAIDGSEESEITVGKAIEITKASEDELCILFQ